MPRRSIRFVLRRPSQDKEDEIIRKQNPSQEEKPYTTMELRFPEDRERQEDITGDFFLRRSNEDDNELHPLRKQYLENRLKDIDYQERQQATQDDFTTRMYGKKDYAEERHNILQELMQGKQSRTPGYKYPDEKFWDSVDKQNGAEKLPQTPEAVSKEIARFEPEYPKEYNRNMQEIENAKKQQLENDKKSWPEINKDIQDGKITPQELSNKQWQTILDKSAEELKNIQGTGRSYCNFYVRNQLLKQGIYMPPDQNANQIKDYMDNNSQIWEKIPKATDAQGNPTDHLDHKAAYQAAKNGDTVIGIYKSPNDSEHGHIVIVNGQQEMIPASQNSWKTDLPPINGYNNSTGEIKIGESLSKQFSLQRESSMDYYRFTGENIDLDKLLGSITKESSPDGGESSSSKE